MPAAMSGTVPIRPDPSRRGLGQQRAIRLETAGHLSGQSRVVHDHPPTLISQEEVSDMPTTSPRTDRTGPTLDGRRGKGERFTRKMGRKAAAVTFSAGALLTGAAATATSAGAAPAAGTQEGCPYGYVCIYPQNAGWNGGHPESNGKYFHYGAYNLHNQFGTHRLFNNQSGVAVARTCTGYNGQGCQGNLNPNNYIDVNLTPINSIVLQPGPS